jgi:hypothetical protein
MHAAVDVPTFAHRWPRFKVIQLSKFGGGGPIGTLIDLARDRRFRGVVICDASELFFSPERWNDQDALYKIAAQRRSWWASAITLRLLLCERFAVLNERLSLRELLKQEIAHKRLPIATYITMRFDRSLSLDLRSIPQLDAFRNRMTDAIVKRQSSPTMSPTQFGKSLANLVPYLRAIHERGGTVIFVRLPSDGQMRRLENEVYPKADYWHQISALVDAKAVHYEDYPALSHFHCPDDSHLDCADATLFTESLATVLAQVLGYDRRPT